MKKYRLKTREELEADPKVTMDEHGDYYHDEYPECVVSKMIDEITPFKAEFESPIDYAVVNVWECYEWMCVEIKEVKKKEKHTKKDDIEFVLNDILNKALITNRIQGIPDSNKIAKFVSAYLQEKNN